MKRTLGFSNFLPTKLCGCEDLAGRIAVHCSGEVAVWALNICFKSSVYTVCVSDALKQ